MRTQELRPSASAVASPPYVKSRGGPCLNGFEDCNSPARARGMCHKHYQRWRTTTGYRMGDSLDRFEAKFYVTPGCWVWTAATVGRAGHGSFRNGRHVLAHRYAYQAYVGSIPRGQVVRHKCDNPKCVNPDHLELGTQADNMRDMAERGRGHWQS